MGKAIAGGRRGGCRLRDRPGPWRRSGRFLRARCAQGEPRTAVSRGNSDPGRHDRPRQERHAAIERRGEADRGPARPEHLARRRRCSRDWSSERPRGSGPTGTSKSWKCITAMKVDAPSGTALLLGQAAAHGRGETSELSRTSTGSARASSARARRDRFRVAARRIGRRRPCGDVPATDGERIELAIAPTAA